MKRETNRDRSDDDINEREKKQTLAGQMVTHQSRVEQRHFVVVRSSITR